MLRSLLTTTALVALVAGGTAVAQTTQEGTAAKPETAVEGTAATGTQTEVQTQSGQAEDGAVTEAAEEAAEATEKAAEETAETAEEAADAVETEMKAEGEAEVDTGTQSAARATGFVTEQDGEEILATEYIGQDVVNAQDESIGKISDLVMDTDGRLTAAVIGVGGFLGIGEKSVGVPIDAIEVRTDAEGDVQLVMQSTREELEAAPEFMDLEDKMQAQEAARQEEERQNMQQQMNPQGTTGTTAPTTGTTN